jgi:hypothetical protein
VPQIKGIRSAIAGNFTAGGNPDLYPRPQKCLHIFHGSRNREPLLG